MPSAIFAVILNYNGFDDTVRCLASIEAAGYDGLRIVLVDNASPSGDGARLKERYPSHAVILRGRNDGYAAGMNAGIRHALAQGAEYVLVMNNDLVVEPGFLDGMLAHLTARPAAGVVTCHATLLAEPARRYHTAGRFSRLRCNIRPYPEKRLRAPLRVDFISGCIFLARADVFRDVGLLDESFFLYFEDFEFSRRVSRRWELWYVPNGSIRHKSGGGTRWSRYTPTYNYYVGRNRFLAFRSEPLPYRLYVAAYAVVNALGKTVATAVAAPKGREKRERIEALWRGVFDGLRVFFGGTGQAPGH
ncbi:MAG: glycosyltransferase family 2 protein [Bacteroidota bacterium]|nr:glycosyltransferase family 2 protein [Bacteroidota bacterium]